MCSTTQTLESEYGRPSLTVDALVPTGATRFHLGRVHVATSPLDVARDVWSALKQADDPRWTHELRRQTIAAALWLHAENLAEYRWVMGGMR